VTAFQELGKKNEKVFYFFFSFLSNLTAFLDYYFLFNLVSEL